MQLSCDNSFVRSGRYRLRAAGYTLTEMLVVIFILSIVVVAALPVAKRVMDDTRSTESARQLSAQAALAKTMAGRNNRPFGLWLEYEVPAGAPLGVKQCTQIYLAEVQPPYAGSTLNSRAKVVQNGTDYELGFFDTNGNADTTVEPVYLANLVDDGDEFLVRFDYRGVWFLFQRVGNRFILQTSAASTLYPPGFNSPTAAAKPFQVLRMPRRVGKPLVMTGGTCIDVQYCGMGPSGSFHYPTTAANRLIVLFAPDGSIDGMFIDNTRVPVTGTLHFLIGQTDKINAPFGGNADHPTGMNLFDVTTSNLMDPNSFWVSIGRLNGSVTSTDNLPPPLDPATLSPTSVTVFPSEAAIPAGRQQTLNPTVAPAATLGVMLLHSRENATTREQRGGN
jgi:prepilin-type N-terminal cleavage/methylation domain-containing protein